MSKLLRHLAFVCLVLGVVCAVQAPANALYWVAAGVWVLLALVVLWLNARLARGAQSLVPRGTRSERSPWLRQPFAETVPATYTSRESRQQALSTVE